MEGNGSGEAVTAAVVAEGRFATIHRPTPREDNTVLFYDQTTDCSDRAEDREGADSSPVIYFAGHGSPGHFFAEGRDTPPIPNECVRIGDKARYYFQHSCNVLAHGKKSRLASAASGNDYLQPWNFTGNIRTKPTDEFNVFRNLGKSFRRGVRLVCGASSLINENDGPSARRFWINLHRRGLDVADSWVLSHYEKLSAPVCISSMFGKQVLSHTPLFDRSFEDEPSYCDEDPRDRTARQVAFVWEVGQDIPRKSTLDIENLLEESSFRAARLYSVDTDIRSGKQFNDCPDSSLSHVNRSNSCSDQGDLYYYDDSPSLDPAERGQLTVDERQSFEDAASDFVLKQAKWPIKVEELKKARVWPLMIDSYLEEPTDDLVRRRYLKNVNVIWTRSLPVEVKGSPGATAGSDLEVAAEQTNNRGTIWVQLTPRMEVVRASMRWSPIVEELFVVDEFTSASEAEECARENLPENEKELYALYGLDWGYRQVDRRDPQGDIDSSKLHPTYVLEFGPESEEALGMTSLQRIEVFAEKNLSELPDDPDLPVRCNPGDQQ